MAKFTFGQIAKEVRLTYNGDKTDMPIVGLEHIVPKELTVTNYDINTNNTFTKSFKKGQILFGRRRAYQHKAAIATFNGICSGDITVIEPIEGMVYPALLPFIVQNDAFFSHAVQGSAGSLSPRVKWEHLSSYEIELPSMEEQRILSEKLWAAYRLKESYKRLLAATDEMVKSQFIEMFGNHSTTPVSHYIDDSYPGEWGVEDRDGSGVKVIRTTNFTNAGKLDLTNVVTRSILEKKVKRKAIKKFDTILERSGGTAENPVGRVVLFEEDDQYLCNNFTQVLRFKDIEPRYAFYALFYYYQMNKTVVRSMGSKTTGIQNLNMNKYLEIGVPDASDEEQRLFIAIAEQADKSKFVGFKSQFIEMLFNKPITGKIGDLVDKKISSVKKIHSMNDIIEYIDISSVERSNHSIVETTFYVASNAPSRAQQCVRMDDILVSTVRPINRNIAVVNSDKNNLVASTGFCVLRPKLGFKEYLLAIVLSDKYTEAMIDKASGGLYPAVNNGDVLNYGIYIPDEEFAKKFSLIYQQTDKSKFELRKSIDAIDQVIKSLING